ncbi:hypothetical protein, partial [Streptomyces lavendulae]|uniref:hypothetical protein n=1 Tax=Streptomyces lavendulae TaxID=1914 RepID=UPI0036921D64
MVTIRQQAGDEPFWPLRSRLYSHPVAGGGGAGAAGPAAPERGPARAEEEAEEGGPDRRDGRT